ncbi:uncharacterized protein LOC111408417 [Olea europaea var. sylvestris]|uniref:uncharacterized protein LOC111408417 n=1 Tax=Olea europaea var. sylvestris TaxID=158386 RepID=UPI000C1D2BD2|nr:uncharacterized protein LOC111408417 [Olea europaea var. sylvestris]
MAHFEALYGRKWRTPICWDGDGKRKLVGPELVQMTSKNVKLLKEKLKGVLRFGKQRKLSPRYIRPYEIIERIGPVAYQLDLPTELSRIHDVFHVSMLRKYIADPSHVLESHPVHLKENLTYTKEPVRMLDRKVQIRWNKTISLVKVLWQNQTVEEVTWEHKDPQMRVQYPHLFVTLSDAS